MKIFYETNQQQIFFLDKKKDVVRSLPLLQSCTKYIICVCMSHTRRGKYQGTCEGDSWWGKHAISPVRPITSFCHLTCSCSFLHALLTSLCFCLLGTSSSTVTNVAALLASSLPHACAVTVYTHVANRVRRDHGRNYTKKNVSNLQVNTKTIPHAFLTRFKGILNIGQTFIH